MQISRPDPRVARRRRLIAVAILSTVVAVIATVASVGRVSLAPPGIELKSREGIAITHAALQFHPPPRRDINGAIESQIKRANLIGNVMASPAVLNQVARLEGVDPDRITGSERTNEDVPATLVEPDNERHANQILVSHDPYKLEIQARSTVPILDIYSQAPSVSEAKAFAEAIIRATNAYLGDLSADHHVAGPQPVALKQLGPAQGALLDPLAPLKIGVLTFLVAFGITAGSFYALVRIRRGWLVGPMPDLNRESGSESKAKPASSRSDDGGDWPHTTRTLPWLIAGFIAMLWLVPVNAIWLEVSLPIDLKLDRLVVPVIVLIWLLSLAAKGPGAPRLRFTRVHAAILGFVAVAFLSVVVNATYLNQTLELAVAIKKLVLLAAFVSVFLVISSVIRPSEVRAFLTFILILATICAVGILWEYRFETNLFYAWSAKLLPSVFHAAPLTVEYDDIGRRAVVGPADLGLEAVAMLSMALPIALVRLMESQRRRQRILYALATCLLLGAMVATFRKSALLAPVCVGLVLAYFRPRALIRLLPVGAVILLAIPVIAPQALGSVIEQFKPHRLGVATVSDRVSDYDAIRPDLLSHPMLGRGYGSYEHRSYRILDNDLLQRLIETGVIGLVAYVLMLLLVFACAVPIARGRDPGRAEVALVVAAGAIAFLVLSALFDIMSFPHGPYILMTLFGLLAVIVAAEEPQATQGSVHRARMALEPIPPPAPNGDRDSLPVPA